MTKSAVLLCMPAAQLQKSMNLRELNISKTLFIQNFSTLSGHLHKQLWKWSGVAHTSPERSKGVLAQLYVSGVCGEEQHDGEPCEQASILNGKSQ